MCSQFLLERAKMDVIDDRYVVKSTTRADTLWQKLLYTLQQEEAATMDITEYTFKTKGI